MFGMGMSEILIICGLALLVFGPTQLPEMVKKIAKGLREVRRASDDFKRSINLDDDDDRPRWRPPVPEPPKPTLSTSTSTSSLEAPPVIPGSALTEAPALMVRSADAVAVGSVVDDAAVVAAGAHGDGEATDPQKPSLSSQAAKEPS
jgi:TatA/E family protein of Tat protein translocase